MRFLPALILLATAAAFSGCASTPAPASSTQVAMAAPAAASAPRQVCTKERPIGSSMAQTVCHNVDDNGNVQDTVDAMNRQISGGNTDMLRRGGAGN